MTRELNLFELDYEETTAESSESSQETESKSKEEQRQIPPAEGDIRGGFLNTLLEKVKKKEEREAKKMELQQEIKSIVEALLFASPEPVSFYKIRQIMQDEEKPCPPSLLAKALEELRLEYLEDKRAFELLEAEEGFVLRSKQVFSCYIDHLFSTKRGERLSQAATEALAIIAYKGPITRSQIEAIRGVDSTGAVQNLLERGLVQQAGRMETAGRPVLFKVTEKFYSHYGIKDPSDLPKLKATDSGLKA